MYKIREAKDLNKSDLKQMFKKCMIVLKKINKVSLISE